MSTEFIPLGVSSSLAEKKTISPTKRKEPNSSHGTSPVKDAYKGFLQNHFFHNNSTPTSSTKLASSPTKLPNLSNSGVAHSLSNGLVTPEKRPKQFTFSQTGSQQSIADSNSSIKHRAIQATNFKTVRGYLQEAKTLPLVLDFEPKSKKKTGLETKSTLNIYEERVLKQISLPKSPAQASSNDKRHLNNILKDVVSGDVLESPLRKKDIHEFLADDLSSPYSPDDLNSNPSPLKLDLKSSESRPLHSPPRNIMTSYGSRVLSEQSFQLHPATHSDDKDSKNSKVSLKFHLAVNQTKIPTLTLSKSVHSPGRHFNFKFSKQELEAALKNSHEKKTENKADHHFNRTATAGGSRIKNNLIEKYKKRINQEFQYRFPQKTNPEIKEESLQSNRYYVPTFVSEDLSKHHQASNSFKISERNSFNEVVFAKVFGSKASHHKTPAHEQQVVDDNLVLGEEEEENEDSEQATNSFTESSYSDDDDNTGSEVSDKMKHVGKRFSGFKIIRRVSQYHKTIKRESFLKKLERVDQAIRSRGQMPAPRITNDDDKFFVTLEKKRKLNNIRKKILSALTRMRALGLTVEDIGSKKIFSTQPFEKEHSEEFINAAKEGNIEKMEELLAVNKFLIYDFDHMHQNAFHWAIKKGHEHVVKYLLDNGADVNLKDMIGRTPLYFAIIYKQYNVMKLLLMRRCDPWSTEEVNYGQLVKNDPKFKQLLSRGRQLHIVLSMSAGYLRASIWQKQSAAFVMEEPPATSNQGSN